MDSVVDEWVNLSESRWVELSECYSSSDHLPVVVDYFVPLVGESSCSAGLVTETNVRYKEGATVASEVGIRTSGIVVVEMGAAVRYYSEETVLAPEFRVELGGMFGVISEAVDCSTFSP